jgi:hypothetical protein
MTTRTRPSVDLSRRGLKSPKHSNELATRVVRERCHVEEVRQVHRRGAAPIPFKRDRELVALVLVAHEASKHVAPAGLDVGEQRRELLISHKAANRTTPSAGVRSRFGQGFRRQASIRSGKQGFSR